MFFATSPVSVPLPEKILFDFHGLPPIYKFLFSLQFAEVKRKSGRMYSMYPGKIYKSFIDIKVYDKFVNIVILFSIII